MSMSYAAGNTRPSAGKSPLPILGGSVRLPSRRQKTQVKWMYDANGNLDKEHLIEGYAPMVKRIAFQLMARLPASVDVDDLIQNGMMGLLDAINRFEDGLGAQFETYAVQRIRGAMLDGLRDNDWLPRSLRRDMRRIEAAIHSLEQAHGRHPSETELAESLGVSLPEYQHMLQEARGHQLVYLEDFNREEGDDYLERHLVQHGANPLEQLEDADMRRRLVTAIEGLPEREKMVMALYYDEELNLREIGEVLGVTESRVCQLHSQAVARLRAGVFHGVVAAAAPRRGRPPKKPAAN
jgi:RNA polymerase sigma factor FliA